MNKEGKILQITGAVVDVKFGDGHLPKIMNALSIKTDDGSEVQISKCPKDHGKIKSPLCCGQDMACRT